MGQRLRTDITPKSYRIEITTDFRTFTFPGKVDIELGLARPSREVTLNASELEIWGAYAEYMGARQRARVSLDREKQQATFRFARPIGSGSTLHVDYRGRNGDGMYGLYRSRFGKGKGSGGYLLSSHCEPAHARTMFPCFDEPSFKATFELSIVTDAGLETVSNMPVRSVAESGKRKRVTFMPTPRMSSYLLYVGVGRFEHVSARYRGKPLRALAAPGRAVQCSKALEFAKAFLAYYERYFGIEYPLPKLDLIAVPDFAAGAMENWGAIAFREQDMLYGAHTSVRTRTRIAEVVAHELAHQWFGDLVTMRWWDDTWLNEAFAEFMSFKAVEDAYPGWKRGLDFYEEEVDVALSADQFRNTHPIYSPIRGVEEIDKVFDDISYRKGASILAMLEDFVGREAFRRGLHRYLVKHSLSNAEKGDLWDALEASSGDAKDVKSLVTAWITLPGFPALHFSGGTATQERFVLRKGRGPGGIWPVPIHYRSADGREGSVLMRGKRLKIPRGGAWTKLNLGQVGVYRVLYGRGELDALSKAVRDGKLGDVDSWGIVRDMAALAGSGRTRVREFLGYMDSFMGCGYPADAAMLSVLVELHRKFHGTPLEGEVRDVMDRYSSQLLGRLGWRARKGELGHEKRLRSGAIVASGRCGNTATVRRCERLFDGARGRPVDNDIRRAVYEVVSMNRDGTFGRLASMYRKAENQEEKFDTLVAMSMARDRGTLDRALRFAMSGEVRPQDAYIVAYAMSINPGEERRLWGWVRSNWKALMERYKPGTLLLDAFVDSLSCARDAKTRAEIAAFFSRKGNNREDIRQKVRKTLELIDVNIDCLKFNSGR